MDIREALASWGQMGHENKGLSHTAKAALFLPHQPPQASGASPGLALSPHRGRHVQLLHFYCSHFQQTNQGANRVYFTLIY